MPYLRAGRYVYDDTEEIVLKDELTKAENKPGHKKFSDYNLPKWVYHPEKPAVDVVIPRQDFYGMAVDGIRNWGLWNVAHVAAYHDDLKLLSLATLEQCKEKNRWGMTPAHMCGLGLHAYGPSTAVLYQLMQMGCVDPEAKNHADQTPWHICQRMHKNENLKKFEKVLLKGGKPDHFDKLLETSLRPRGKFIRAGLTMDMPSSIEDATSALPVLLMFPGQGSQHVGMLAGANSLPTVPPLLQKAKEILGYDLLDLCLTGPEEKLQQTEYCQPAVFVAGMAAIEQLKKDDPETVSRCYAMAGLSLGEYTALTVAGVFDFETALRLVKARGEAMAEAGKSGGFEQAMISVAGLEKTKLESLCNEILQGRPGEVCQIANHLFPKGYSVAGTEGALQELETKAMAAGALQARMLKASGAFHTRYMESARDKLTTALEAARPSMKSPRCQVYMNRTAQAIGPQTSVDEIIQLLSEQIVSPVLWDQSIQKAIEDGCSQFYECGPSKQLKAMLKRINPRAADKAQNIAV